MGILSHLFSEDNEAIDHTESQQQQQPDAAPKSSQHDDDEAEFEPPPRPLTALVQSMFGGNSERVDHTGSQQQSQQQPPTVHIAHAEQEEEFEHPRPLTALVRSTYQMFGGKLQEEESIHASPACAAPGSYPPTKPHEALEAENIELEWQEHTIVDATKNKHRRTSQTA